MARRPKTAPLEDVVHLVAFLPWWACLGVALLSYLLLHSLAQPVMTSFQPDQMSQLIFRSWFKGLAMAGQYIVPILCLAAAAVSVARRRKRSSLVMNVAEGRAPDVLEGMSWQDFERLVGEAFRLQGYEVTEQGGGGPDGGVDLVLRKDREKFLVQCKQWKAFKVGVQVVRELYGVMAAQGAAGGFVVTSGKFTEEAKSFASGRNVQLVDGPKLFGMIQQAKTARGQARNAEAPRRSRPVTPFTAATAPPIPTCPKCSSAMERRLATRGPNSGNAFWGCASYPSCRGTRPIG